MTTSATLASVRRRIYHRIAQDKLISAIAAFWLVLVYWSELGDLQWTLARCSWPDRAIGSKSKAAHILLIADPQLRHPLIYGNGLSYWNTFWEFMRDATLRRRWQAAIAVKRPDAILVMGDMMLGRSVMTESQYDLYFNHFRHTLPAGRTPVHYIPGNDDVGLGTSSHFSKYARRRYNQHFGRPNQKLSIANHTLVLVDAPGIVEEDYKRVASKKDFASWPPTPNGPIEFIKSVADSDDGQPVILFSHIPLHRPESASCGPLRERGTIRKGVGFGYQNTLGKQTTEWVLSTLQPALVFSADDRDYCEYTHVPPLDPARDGAPSSPQVKEVTVKSFSPVRHIRHPGLHLLSLVPPTSAPGPPAADAPCLLPDELHNYAAAYAPALLLTSLLLLVAHYRRARGTLRLATDKRPNGFHIAPPESAVWSPLPTPARGLPTTRIRAPTHAHARSDSLTASVAAPGTPLSPAFFPGARTPLYDEEDLEPVALSPGFPFRRDEKRAPEYDDEYDSDEEKDADAAFLPAPAPRKRAGGGWVWTFGHNGRRRRITMRLPWGGSERAQTPGMAARRRKRALIAAVRDLGTVLWPAAVLWVFILWWTS